MVCVWGDTEQGSPQPSPPWPPAPGAQCAVRASLCCQPGCWDAVWVLSAFPTLCQPAQQAPLPWQRIAKSTQRETALGRLVLPKAWGGFPWQR